MPYRRPLAKPGRKPRPRSKLEAILQAAETAVSVRRRKISRKDRRFVDLYLESDCTDAEGSAITAGFTGAGSGFRLVSRLSDLIQAERARRLMTDQMEADEALRLLSEIARDTVDRKVQHSALRTVLQVHGYLHDRPIPTADRRVLAAQIEDLVAKIRSKPGMRARVAAMAVEITSDKPETDANGSESRPYTLPDTVTAPPDREQ